MRRVRALAALASAIVLLAPWSPAQTDPSPSATPTAPFDRVDTVTLMAVVIEELKQDQGSILLVTRPTSAMPRWDPLVFWAGIGADKHQPFRPIVWTVADTKSKGYEHALIRAYVMAVMDTGEAGPKFKMAYDAASNEDLALPSDAPDPYRYRHAVAEPFVAEMTQTDDMR
ncbi:MAG TPA: hypothetical protein VK216_01235 [Magnetospirillaceae bacterium]|nr:hypothetical protein [Magnetospirillaceae bacterium]